MNQKQQSQKEKEKQAGALTPVLHDVPGHLHSLNAAFVASVINDDEIPDHRKKHYQRLALIIGSLVNLLPEKDFF